MCTKHEGEFMRRLLPLGLILILVVAAFAEEHPGRNATPGHSEGQGNGNSEGHGNGNRDKDDHDDNGPVQAGFAIITPSATTGGGTMAVFATFGLRKGNDVPQAGVLPSGLTTNALMFVSSSGRLSRNLGVAIVNPDSSTANVTLTLRDDKGVQLAPTKTIQVAAHNQTSKFVTELFSNESGVPKDLTGTLAITSTTSTSPVAVPVAIPVGVIGLRFRGSNFSTLPVTNLSSSTPAVPAFSGAGGSGAVLLPEFAAGGGWATEIVVANTGTSTLTVRLDLFKQDGSPLTTSLNGTTASSFTGLSIPGGGVLSLAPRDNKGDSDF
jgi:hypothetical protein